MDKIIAECNGGYISKRINLSFGYFFVPLLENTEVIQAYIEADTESEE